MKQLLEKLQYATGQGLTFRLHPAEIVLIIKAILELQEKVTQLEIDQTPKSYWGQELAE